MKEQKLKEILSQTGGVLRYHDQFYKICTDILDLTKEEADYMRKAYGKKTLEMKKYDQLIIDRVNNKELADQIIFICSMQLPYATWKCVADLREENGHMVINNILNKTNGELKYHFQAHVILTDVARLNMYQADSVITNYAKKELWETEREFLSRELSNLPSLLDRIHELLCKYAGSLEKDFPMSS